MTDRHHERVREDDPQDEFWDEAGPWEDEHFPGGCLGYAALGAVILLGTALLHWIAGIAGGH